MDNPRFGHEWETMVIVQHIHSEMYTQHMLCSLIQKSCGT
jgi:hypothetical protein